MIADSTLKVAPRAAVDIGTNSTRLLIAALVDGRLTPLDYQERLTRLGEGLQADGRLDEAAMTRVIDALRAYRETIVRLGAGKDVRLFATSATRDAANRDPFLQKIEAQTGWRVRVLSGDEEARLTFAGIADDLAPQEHALICDVGGGSTELIFTDGRKMMHAVSIDVGSSRMTRRFLHGDPPTSGEVEALRAFVRAHLPMAAGGETMVASGGTAFTLALMDLRQPITQPWAAHGHRLTQTKLGRLTERLTAATQAQRRKMVGLHPQRAEVMAAGAIIYQEIMAHFHQSLMRVSLKDILFGVLKEERW